MIDDFDWSFERYRLGELPPDEVDRIERMALLDRSDAEILARYPPAETTRSIRERYQANRFSTLGRGLPVLVAAPAILAAALALISTELFSAKIVATGVEETFRTPDDMVGQTLFGDRGRENLRAIRRCGSSSRSRGSQPRRPDRH